MAKFKRILLKLSGESLMGEQGYGIDVKRLNEYAAQIKEAQEMGVEIGIVIGGGKDGFSKKQWAVCDRTLMKELVKIVYGTKPTVMENELDNPLIQQFTAYADFGMGWGDSRQIIFSNPN